jgi:hypothetical protein
VLPSHVLGCRVPNPPLCKDVIQFPSRGCIMPSYAIEPERVTENHLKKARKDVITNLPCYREVKIIKDIKAWVEKSLSNLFWPIQKA